MKLKLAYGLSIAAIALGTILMGVFLYWSLVDYAALNEAWVRLMSLSKAEASTQRLLVALGVQDAHRINLACEIVALMISALITAVGGHALVTCLLRDRGDGVTRK